ncbi:glycosyltransferase [Xylophilus ampelinus]|uniref:Glycosyltransferase involved in cell wall biosynthesis n=1 Tax=Xylophilus ampelinus TaxID=54067 RepID=A0A318SP39_9BURK|nr:glycosyltransferase [Xylophilus ampelinus]MCS4509742.1 glycosyltransferase [Xylophilus ampelinus]PYE78730.1 glycosyltransferase involved in cell wall biosynthesis [Xylophilus ampelinus]
MAARRVLHVGKFFPPHVGGMEVFLSDLVHAQRAQGLEAFALVHGEPLPDDPDWLVRVPVQAHLLYAPIAAGFPLALARAIARFRPQVLHLHMPNNSVFWASTLPSALALPWVVHWHSDVVPSRIRGLVAAAYRAYRPFEWTVLERAERIVVTSPPYLEHSVPLRPWLRKCVVVPLGLDVTPPMDLGHPPPARDAAHWRAGAFRLLSIGRLAYYKGFETLVRAVSATPGVELLIAGDGELRTPLEALVRAHAMAGEPPRVRLLGKVSDAVKAELLGNCELFCLPSRERTEAFGMVLLEAMRHARPCLVSDLPGSGMPWVVREAKAGECVPLQDVAAWKAAIQRLQHDPARRKRYGRAGRDALHARFSIDACVTGLAAAYAIGASDTPAPAAEHRILVVIPAKDESATVGTVVAELIAAGYPDIVVIDDHSTDDTARLARDAGARVLRPPLPVGAWGGMQTGIRYALQKGYAGVVTMDADGQHEVGQVQALLGGRDRADMVIGAFPERASRLRRWAWGWFRRLASFDLRDLTSGFRFYNHDAMQLLSSGDATLLDYQDLGALLTASRAGMRIAEIPVVMQARATGKSRVFRSWFGVARYMALTTLLCLSRRAPARARRTV